MPQFRYRKRAFLNPVSSGQTSYVYGEAESSDNGDYKLGNYILIIADCRRRIEFEFFLGTARYRKLSLAKADLLVQTLTDFRDALYAEAALIDKNRETSRDL